MRKFFGWSLVNAFLLAWCGISQAEVYDNPSCAAGVGCCDNTLSNECQEECCECLGNWFDNTVIFGGGDVYKSIGDRVIGGVPNPLSLSSSFGAVTGFNTGFGLGDSKIRGQIGASYGVYDFSGRTTLPVQVTQPEEQSFVTLGVYKRGDMLNDCDRISWGVVYDNFRANQYGANANTLNLGQIRAIGGYALNECTEIGGWGTFHVFNDVLVGPVVNAQVRAANQANAYVRRNTAFGGSLMGYVGAFDRADIQGWQFGLTGQAPLSCNVSLYGNFNYAVPSAAAGNAGSAEEQFNASFGLAYYFGGKAVSPSVTGQQGLPLLNVANNGSFMVTD